MLSLGSLRGHGAQVEARAGPQGPDSRSSADGEDRRGSVQAAPESGEISGFRTNPRDVGRGTRGHPAISLATSETKVRHEARLLSANWQIPQGAALPVACSRGKAVGKALDARDNGNSGTNSGKHQESQ